MQKIKSVQRNRGVDERMYVTYRKKTDQLVCWEEWAHSSGHYWGPWKQARDEVQAKSNQNADRFGFYCSTRCASHQRQANHHQYAVIILFEFQATASLESRHCKSWSVRKFHASLRQYYKNTAAQSTTWLTQCSDMQYTDNCPYKYRYRSHVSNQPTRPTAAIMCLSFVKVSVKTCCKRNIAGESRHLYEVDVPSTTCLCIDCLIMFITMPKVLRVEETTLWTPCSCWSWIYCSKVVGPHPHQKASSWCMIGGET